MNLFLHGGRYIYNKCLENVIDPDGETSNICI